MSEPPHVGSGKVRELYALDDDRLLLVASDRISTFDVVLPTEIPDKGRVLTGLSASGSPGRGHLVPNHLLALREDGRSTECRRLEMLPIECVVRGYLAGSGWKDYLATATVCGHTLPTGLVESQRLPEPIFTPATKAQSGHDENIDRETAAELVGVEQFDEVERIALALYGFVSDPPASAESSWPTRSSSSGSTTPAAWYSATRPSRRTRHGSGPRTSTSPAATPPSFDKQFVRDYCESLGWDKSDPGPELPESVVAGTRARYVEAFERLTEHRLRRLPRRPERGARVKATVLVRPKPGILDPQGQAVESSLRQLGFEVGGARVGRLVDVEFADRGPRAGARPARADVRAAAHQPADRELLDRARARMSGGDAPRPVVAVIVFPGSNDDRDAQLALERLGAEATRSGTPTSSSRRRRPQSSFPEGSRTATTSGVARSHASRP